MRPRHVALIATLALGVGCAPLVPVATPTMAPTVTPSPAPTATARATSQPTPLPTPPVVVEGLDSVPAGSTRPVLAAIADLAERLQLPKDAEVSVVEVESRQWPDTSLGCPQPGMVYAQVITPGYLVVLEAEGEEYEYHTDRRGVVVLCEESMTTDQDAGPTHNE